MKYQNNRISDKLTIFFVNTSCWLILLIICLVYLNKSDSKLIKDVSKNLKEKAAQYDACVKLKAFLTKNKRSDCSVKNSCEGKKEDVVCNNESTDEGLKPEKSSSPEPIGCKREIVCENKEDNLICVKETVSNDKNIEIERDSVVASTESETIQVKETNDNLDELAGENRNIVLNNA